MPELKLELETGTALINPDAASISNSLTDSRGFVILSRDPMTYIQASGSAGDGFMLEYQEGDTARHYQCPESLSLEQTIGAFISYAQADEAWRASVPWRSEAGIAREAQGPLPRSLNNHLWLTSICEIAGGLGAPALWILYHFFYVGSFPSGVRGGVEFIGLFIAGILIPRAIFRHVIGARCPAPGCGGKAFPRGSMPITYVCKACGRAYPTEVDEGSDGTAA